MFTGIVVDKGSIRRIRGRGVVTLQIEAPEVARDLRLGESVAVNGVCLTATTTGRRRFEVEVMGETLDRSTIGLLKKGSDVNLELAMRLNERLGGHLVQGHVDGIATVSRIEDDEGASRVWFAAPEDLLDYMVAKGSVTLDGVSLTIVPHTLAVTTLGRLEVGTKVNVEVDILAKYVERLMARS
jgi:riboflavin synthase